MNLNIRGKNIQVTPALRDHVERRIGKLEKFLQFDEAQVTLSVEKDRQKVEVTIPLTNYIIRGEEETPDMYSSVDMVIEKLEKQVDKYKTRFYNKNRNGSIKDLEFKRMDEKDEDSTQEVVRTKRFTLKPMSVDEAILQMNLLGHNFFVFTNAETNQTNVVYQRKDKNYGLIEPEV